MADSAAGNSPHRIDAVTFLSSTDVARDFVEDMVTRASRRLAVPCRLHVTPWDARARRLAGRDQVDADALLATIDSSTEPGTVWMGVTAHDIGLALFTFVFGRARRYGHAALVSLARLGPESYGLPPDPDLVARRAVAEIMHELGHVAGLVHCRDMNCVMFFATNVETIDVRGTGFCAACAAQLPPHLVAPAPVQA